MAKVVARAYFDVIGLDQGGLHCDDPSLAVQASKEECDINNIINKCLRTGELPEQRQGAFMALSELPDLQEAMNQVALAQEAFAALPAHVRKVFDNDPVKLVEASQDARNQQLFIDLGLAVPRQPAPSPAGQAGGAGTEPARPDPSAAPRGAAGPVTT